MSSSIAPLDDEELQKIYVWVDSVPLSRPKRNISRDFSDGGELIGMRWIYINSWVILLTKAH